MTKFRSTLLFIGPILLIGIILSFFVYRQLSENIKSDMYDILDNRTKLIAQYEILAAHNNIDTSIQHKNIKGGQIIKIGHSQGFPILSESSILQDELISQLIEKKEFFYSKDEQFNLGRIYEINHDKYLITSSSINYFASHLSYLKQTFIYYILIFTVIILLYYFFYLKNIYQPIKTIITQVKQITTNNLSERLNEKYRIKELKNLSKTFNSMLNRIETSFETQSNFVSNASHELRTPLTSIIGEADVTLSKLREPERYIETLKIILEEAEKLDTKTKALLFLAQTGSSSLSKKFDKIRIDQVLMDVKNTIVSITPKSKITFDLSLLPDNPWLIKIYGNNELLHLAFSNIINNACKYSNNQPVGVAIASSNNKIHVVIKDQGIGIPKDDLEHIYEPFFRASNTKNYEGFGIGLPLVMNIIKLHKGKIKIHSLEGRGTTVEVTFPIYKQILNFSVA